MHSIAYWKMNYNSELMNQNFMIPCNLCKFLLHNFSIRKTSSKLRHVLQITNRISHTLWEGNPNISGKIVNKSLHFHLTIKKDCRLRDSPSVSQLCNSYASVRFFINNRYPSVSTTPTGSEIHADCTNPATM